MRRSSRIVVGLVAIVAATSGAFVWKKARSGPKDTSELALPAPGRQTVLHVVWNEKSTARIPKSEAAGLADTIPGELELDADLVLDASGR